MKWEEIDPLTYKAKVHGGWIVKHYESLVDDGGDTVAHGFFSMVFVPDPLGQWI